MSGFDCYLFDLDGTLADSAEDIARGANHAMEKLGRPPIPLPLIKSYIGSGVRALLKRCLNDEAGELAEKAYPFFTEFYAAHLLDNSRLYDGVPECLEALKTKKKAVITNKPEALSRTILATLGILDRFDDIIGGDTLPYRKPHPGGVESLIAKYGVARERTLFIGDSMIDIETARAAGVRCCLVTYGYSKGGERDHADYVIDSIRNIPSIA